MADQLSEMLAENAFAIGDLLKITCGKYEIHINLCKEPCGYETEVIEKDTQQRVYIGGKCRWWVDDFQEVVNKLRHVR